MAGQGLSEEQQHAIYGLAARRGYSQNFTDWFKWVKKPADTRMTHKHKPENILISVPSQLDDNLYKVDLIIHPRNELIIDHQTGQHIQGMILLEASRQTFIAVAEKFFLDGCNKHYFVINSMAIKFQSFVFPLPAHVECRIVDRGVDKNNNFKSNVEIKFLQSGECAATACADFKVIDTSYISQREAALAAKKISDFIVL